VAPMPSFVAAAGAPTSMIARLRAAFLAAHRQSWFAPLSEPLLLEGFAQVSAQTFTPLLQWDVDARAAGFERPA